MSTLHVINVTLLFVLISYGKDGLAQYMGYYPYGYGYGNTAGSGYGFYAQYPSYSGGGSYPCYGNYFCSGNFPYYGSYPYNGNGLNTAYASSTNGIAQASAGGYNG